MSALEPRYKDYLGPKIIGEQDNDILLTEESFHAGACLCEGVSGKQGIDSTYERPRHERVLNSRSNNDLKEDYPHT